MTDEQALALVIKTIAQAVPGGAALDSSMVPAVTSAGTDLLTAAKQYADPSDTVQDFLTRFTGSQALDWNNPLQAVNAMRRALSGAYPAVQASGILTVSATTGAGSGASGSSSTPPTNSAGTGTGPGPASSAGGAATASGDTLDQWMNELGTTQLPTEPEADWLEAQIGDRRIGPLVYYYTQWSQAVPDGTPSVAEIEQRMTSARALEAAAAVLDAAFAPTVLAGWSRIKSDESLGRKTHAVVQAQYNQQHPSNVVCADGNLTNCSPVKKLGDLNSQSTGDAFLDEQLKLFADALKNSNNRSGRTSTLRIDLADFASSERSLYGIKPTSHAVEALLQLWAYQTYVNLGFEYLPGKPLMDAGSWPPVPFVALVDDESGPPVYAFVFQFPGGLGFPALPGLIFYELYVQTVEEQDQADDMATAAQIALLAACAMNSLAQRMGGQSLPAPVGQPQESPAPAPAPAPVPQAPGVVPSPAPAANDDPGEAANDDQETGPAEQPAAAAFSAADLLVVLAVVILAILILAFAVEIAAAVAALVAALAAAIELLLGAAAAAPFIAEFLTAVAGMAGSLQPLASS